ncbi:MAG TPA: hypothetical protein VFX96_14780, partial [Pyrinomonadaceae bacterium]|nr:hypothetical protein [Pyrinomonadaceae bacterium]
MKTANPNRQLRRFASLAVALSLVLGIVLVDRQFVPATRAQTPGVAKDKVSSDLRKKVKETTADSYVNVIVRPASAWTSALDNDLKTKGASQKTAY